MKLLLVLLVIFIALAGILFFVVRILSKKLAKVKKDYKELKTNVEMFYEKVQQVNQENSALFGSSRIDSFSSALDILRNCATVDK